MTKKREENLEPEKNSEEKSKVDEVLDQEENQLFVPENFDDEYESGGLFTGAKYDTPDDADAFVETGEGKIIKREDMTPFEIIKSIAKENGTELKDPKKDCKYCYERGYEGFETITKMPVPCRCLFRGKTEKEKEAEGVYDSGRINGRITRRQRRAMARMLKKNFEIQRKIEKRRKERGTDSNTVELKEPSARHINKVLREYIKRESLKDTATSLNLTLTETKKIVKGNKEKLEKLKVKGNK